MHMPPHWPFWQFIEQHSLFWPQPCPMDLQLEQTPFWQCCEQHAPSQKHCVPSIPQPPCMQMPF